LGEDRFVWEKIKSNSDIAYFIQNASVLSSNEEEQAQLLDEIEQLIAKYPNSSLTQQINESLSKFRESEIKGREYLEMLKRQRQGGTIGKDQ
jgi:outer membrane protein assembly factor BamD (BamD/ComL family)